VRRGEVYDVQLDPVVAGEATKLRPCILVSNEGANGYVTRHGRGVLTFVPLTSNVTTVHEFQVAVDGPDDLALMGLDRPCTAQAEQVRALAHPRIGRYRGVTPAWILHQVDDALRFHLSL
jgi:mRNA interferase MazF